MSNRLNLHFQSGGDAVQVEHGDERRGQHERVQGAREERRLPRRRPRGKVHRLWILRHHAQDLGREIAGKCFFLPKYVQNILP